jgi:hypothetical protein
MTRPESQVRNRLTAEGTGFEPVWGFSCQVVVFGLLAVTLAHLRVFATVVDEGGFTAAAKRLGLTHHVREHFGLKALAVRSLWLRRALVCA